MTLAAMAFGHWMLLIGVIFVGMHMDVHGCTWMYIVHHCVARIKHAVYYIIIYIYIYIYINRLKYHCLFIVPSLNNILQHVVRPSRDRIHDGNMFFAAELRRHDAVGTGNVGR